MILFSNILRPTDSVEISDSVILALAAELNGYPGPVHVLENAEALRLTPDQLERTRSLFEAMKNEAVPLGERLIQQEPMLDRLRRTHLKYHLAMIELLSQSQVESYQQLRGYGTSRGDVPHDAHHH